jgi:micrococcal nuclease
VVLAALALTGCEGGGLASSEPARATVLRVTDGDTIRVRLDGGGVERVRYIGIDTPERGRCFARQATAANARLLGRRIRLEYDADRRDRYGRLLAYVRGRGGRMVNAELVRGGFAKPLTVAPNVRQAARLGRLARGARRAGRGLWRACGS